MEKRVTIDNNGRKISAVMHFPLEKKFPWMVTSHGFFSSKESDKFVTIGDLFSRNKMAVLRFDFSGCGESDGKIEDTTLTQRIQDLQSVLNFLKNEFSIEEGIGLLGSSLGGCVSILTAAGNPEIKALVSMATPAYFNDLTSLDEPSHESGGEKIEKTFIDDVGKYDILSSLKEINCPILIIHGDQDEEVPVSHARMLHEVAKEPKKLVIIGGGNHSLSDVSHRKAAIRLSLEWSEKYLRNKF